MAATNFSGLTRDFMNRDYLYVPAKNIRDYLADKCRRVKTSITFKYGECVHNVWMVTENGKTMLVTDSIGLRDDDEGEGSIRSGLRAVSLHNGRLTVSYI